MPNRRALLLHERRPLGAEAQAAVPMVHGKTGNVFHVPLGAVAAPIKILDLLHEGPPSGLVAQTAVPWFHGKAWNVFYISVRPVEASIMSLDGGWKLLLSLMLPEKIPQAPQGTFGHQYTPAIGRQR